MAVGVSFAMKFMSISVSAASRSARGVQSFRLDKERDAPIRIDNPMSSFNAEIPSGERDLLSFSLVRILLFFINAIFGHPFDDQGGKICSINAL